MISTETQPRTENSTAKIPWQKDKVMTKVPPEALTSTPSYYLRSKTNMCTICLINGNKDPTNCTINMKPGIVGSRERGTRSWKKVISNLPTQVMPDNRALIEINKTAIDRIIEVAFGKAHLRANIKRQRNFSKLMSLHQGLKRERRERGQTTPSTTSILKSS